MENGFVALMSPDDEGDDNFTVLSISFAGNMVVKEEREEDGGSNLLK